MKFYHYIEEFKNELKLRNLADTTIKSYSKQCLYLFQYYNKPPLEITEPELKTYILYLKQKGLAAKSRNLSIFSIKQYYSLIDKRTTVNISTNIPRQKEPKNLPAVLSKEDVVKMLAGVENIKHRAILTIAYTSGLRIDETRRLKISDINKDRKTILINGKGSRQRFTPLCDEALRVLRNYYKFFRPKFWLFEGSDGNSPISSRSLHQIIKNALQKSGIKQKASFHTLRHCCATHLLEAGVNLRTIQKLLGHKHINSTLIYTHVAEEVIVKIKSPLADVSLPVTHVHMGRGGVK